MTIFPHQPKCNCLECRTYALVYSSIFSVYKCLECESEVKEEHVQNVIEAFSVFKSSNPPIIIPKYNAIHCLSCLKTGGISFQDRIIESVICTLCNCSIRIFELQDAMVTAYRTKLIEKCYNTKYPIFDKKSLRKNA